MSLTVGSLHPWLYCTDTSPNKLSILSSPGDHHHALQPWHGCLQHPAAHARPSFQTALRMSASASRSNCPLAPLWSPLSSMLISPGALSDFIKSHLHVCHLFRRSCGGELSSRFAGPFLYLAYTGPLFLALVSFLLSLPPAMSSLSSLLIALLLRPLLPAVFCCVSWAQHSTDDGYGDWANPGIRSWTQGSPTG